MDVNTVPASLIALAGTIFGGVGLEITRRWLNRSKEKDDVATAIRTELRAEIVGLKKEIDDLEKELTDWKNRYFTLKEEYLLARVQIESQINEAHKITTDVVPIRLENHDDNQGG